MRKKNAVVNFNHSKKVDKQLKRIWTNFQIEFLTMLRVNPL